MRTEKLGKYGIKVPKKKAFAVDTPQDEIVLHQLNVLVGRRGGGKTLACFNKIRHFQEQNLCDRVFLISPTAESNKEILNMIQINPDDIYSRPEKESLISILEKIDDEKMEWDLYENKLKKYHQLMKFLQRKDKSLVEVNSLWQILGGTDDLLEKPESKYGHKPIIMVVIDDCVATPLFSTSTKSPLINFLLRHRHVSGGLGCSVFLLAQCYVAQTGGLPRSLRENVTSLCLFKTKDKKTMGKIADELANDIDPETFLKAYKIAVEQPFGFLFVDFAPRSDKYRFRIGWDKLLIVEDVDAPDDE